MHIFFMVYKAVNLVQYSKYFGVCMRVKIGKLRKTLYTYKREGRVNHNYHYVHLYDILPSHYFLFVGIRKEC